MLHADEGLLHSYLDGALPAAERAGIEAHLRECAECRASLESARALIARASSLLGAAAPPERDMPDFAAFRPAKRRRWRVPAAWAASIMAAFATGWYLHLQRDTGHFADNTTEIAGARPRLPEPAAPPTRPVPPTPPAPPVQAPAPASSPLARSDAKAAAAAPARDLAATGAAMPEEDRLSSARLDAQAAATVLGRAPATLRDRPVLSMTQIPDEEGGGVVIEQDLGAGAVIRLYERQVPGRRDEAAPQARSRAREPANERLARYLGTLRVEIAGPLAADSLSKLLDLVK
jgi:anti-sigma factor RsiW